MLSFLCKNVLKISGNASLKSTPSCILSQTHKYLSIKSIPKSLTKNNNSIVSVFKTHGFTETQISNLLSERLLSVSSKTKPKLDFFTSFGFSTSDICHILALDPLVLRRSLKDQLVPCFEFLKGLLKDNASVIASIKRFPRILRQDLKKSLGPNVDLLRNYGMPDYRISEIVRTQPRNLSVDAYKFKMLVEEVKEMGFDPAKRHFVEVIHVMQMSKSTRERKWDIFRKWGLSNDEILSAFKKHPLLVSPSKERIERVMGFLVNKMGWDASKVSSCPYVFSRSFENRIKPRCLVIQFLLSKGVLKDHFTLGAFMLMTEDQFKGRFMDRYCVEYPEVLKFHQRMEDK